MVRPYFCVYQRSFFMNLSPDFSRFTSLMDKYRYIILDRIQKAVYTINGFNYIVN